MPMGLSNIEPVATNTTLIHKKFPVNENEDLTTDYIEKYQDIYDEYDEINNYQTKQLNYIKEQSTVADLDKLYIVYKIYDETNDLLFNFKQELQNKKPKYKNLIYYRSSLNILFNKLLSQIILYISYINNQKDKAKIEINKKDIDSYDMLVPSEKKDWLVNKTF